MEMYCGSYEGDGLDNRSITGVGFAPDFVGIKGEGEQYAWFSTTSLQTFAAGATVQFYFTYSTIDLIQALDADGFEVGASDEVNKDGVIYYFVCFRDDGAGDFAEGTYAGDGNDDTSISGLGFVPEVVGVKGYGFEFGGYHPDTFGRSVDDTLAWYNNSRLGADHIQALEGDGFEVGTAKNVNTRTYAYIAWRHTYGRMNSFGYTGNAVANHCISGVGFQPEYLWVQASAGTVDTVQKMSSHPEADSAVFMNNSNVSNLWINLFQADGFRVDSVGGHALVNGAAMPYFCVAWSISVDPAAYVPKPTSLDVPAIY